MQILINNPNVNVGLVQGTPEFELVKLNILNLLRSRGRSDLESVWEEFLAKFPDDALDEKVPFENIYEELLSKPERTQR